MHLKSEQVHVAVVFTCCRVFDIVIFVDNYLTKCLAQCDLLMLDRLSDVLWTPCDVWTTVLRRIYRNLARMTSDVQKKILKWKLFHQCVTIGVVTALLDFHQNYIGTLIRNAGGKCQFILFPHRQSVISVRSDKKYVYYAMYICVMSMIDGLYLTLELKCTHTRFYPAVKHELSSSCTRVTHQNVLKNDTDLQHFSCL